MERLLAGWFAEGSSYLASAWRGAAEKETGKEKGDDCGLEGVAVEARRSSRTKTDDSTVSTSSNTSTSSRNSSATSRSNQKMQKVMSWMVFGSKKVLHKTHKEEGVASKKSALDIINAVNALHRDLEILNPLSLKAVSVIGRGGYGKVMLMRDTTSGKLVAVKEVPKSSLIDKPGSTRGVRPVSTKSEHAEMENLVLHTASSHPFITTFHGSFQNKDKIFMFMEYAPGGELFAHMRGVFSESRTRLYVAEITSALAFLHEKGIVYRDLKPENILLDNRGHLRLADFGLSIQFNKHGDDNSMRCFSICGTPEYISPELILCATTRKNDKNATYGKTVDWWALGILMYEMLYRIPPFYSRDRKTMLNKILACDLQFPTAPKAPQVSAEAKDFISKLLKYEEKDRLGFGNEGSARVTAHPLFSGLDWNKVHAMEVEPEFVPELKELTDTSNFDTTFTRELLRVDPFSACPLNLELSGYSSLPDDFDEHQWYDLKTPSRGLLKTKRTSSMSSASSPTEPCGDSVSAEADVAPATAAVMTAATL